MYGGSWSTLIFLSGVSSFRSVLFTLHPNSCVLLLRPAIAKSEVFTVAAGLPPMIDFSSSDVRQVSGLKEELIGTQEASEYGARMHKSSGAIGPSSSEPPDSMLSTASILLAAKYRMAAITKEMLSLFVGILQFLFRLPDGFGGFKTQITPHTRLTPRESSSELLNLTINGNTQTLISSTVRSKIHRTSGSHTDEVKNKSYGERTEGWDQQNSVHSSTHIFELRFSSPCFAK